MTRTLEFFDRHQPWFVRLAVFSALVLAVIYGVANLDRRPPIEVRGVYAAKTAEAGSDLPILLDIRYRRAECSRDTDRLIQDGGGKVISIGDDAIGAQARAMMIRSGREDREVSFKVPVPIIASPGPGKYISISRYVCNRFQWLWPIEMRIEAPFIITGTAR